MMRFEKNTRQLSLYLLYFLIPVLASGQVGISEIVPFMQANTALFITAGGYNFDNDEFLDVVGIAGVTDNDGKRQPRSTYLVHLEESITGDFNLLWKYPLPEGIKADFSDILVTDSDLDGSPEIFALLNISDAADVKNPPWLLCFEYNEGFPSEPDAQLSTVAGLTVRPRPRYISCGDLNSDDTPDFIISMSGPGRGVIVLTCQGNLNSENLQVIFRSSDLKPIPGILPFRAVAADMDPLEGDELVILGGDDQLLAEVYRLELSNSPLYTYRFKNISRDMCALNKLRRGDLDGDGYSEIAIPLYQGGFSLLWSDFEQLQSAVLLSDKPVAALLIADINDNGLDDILIYRSDDMGIYSYEYTLTGKLGNNDSYQLSYYENRFLKDMTYLDMQPVVSVTNKFTGAIIIPFLNRLDTKHGLCYWRISELAPFSDEGLIGEVLEEIEPIFKQDTTAGAAELFKEMEEVAQDLTGYVGEEVPLSPVPTTKEDYISEKSIREVFQPDILVHPGEPVRHHIKVPGLTLEDLKDLTFDTDIPDGMKFDLAKRLYSWVPVDSQLGLHTIISEFRWGEHRIEKRFTIYVNDPIRITAHIPARDIIQIGETFRLRVTVADSNQNPYVGFRLVNYPRGTTIDAHGEVLWKPSFEQTDWHDFLIEVTDGYDTDQLGFSLFVNHPVEIVSTAPTLTSVGKPYLYTPAIEDKNRGFYIPDYPLSPRIENWKTSGVYETKIIDENIRNNLDKIVERFRKNHAVSTPVSSGNITEKELLREALSDDNRLVLLFNIIDDLVPSGEEVINTFFKTLSLSTPKHTKPLRRYYYIYTLKEAPNGLKMYPTGRISWLPSKNQFDYQSISYTVSDGFFTAEEHAQVYVNSPPVIISTPDTGAYANSLWEYELKVTDVNTDSKISYELLKAPEGMVVSPHGRITWKPTELQLNQHRFQVKVSDGMASDVQTGHVFVNIKPKIMSVPKPVALTNLKWEYTLEAEDPNGDPLSYKAVRLPKHAHFDPTTGLLTWKPKKSQKGVNDIVLEVVDSHGWSTLQEIQVHVFHNPGTQRLNFLRSTISLLALIGVIYVVAT